MKPMPKDQPKNKQPDLRVVEALHPGTKPQINSLGERLEQVVNDYCDQEHKAGRIVTFAEIIGTIEILKNRMLPR